MEKTLLEVKNLKKYFSTSAGPLHAVDSISFKLRRGTTLGVVGESGCGKSTLGRLILHLLPVTDGQIFYDGEDITNPNRKKLRLLRRNMQMVFQDPYSSLNPRQTVADIIGEPLVIYKVSESKKDLGIRTRDIMEIVGLPSRYETTYPHELDGGRRQRVGLGRAIALNPQLIVCDEPVSPLDVSIQAKILNLLQDLKNQMGLTYLYITHDLSVVKHISDEIMVMYLGVMVEKSPTDDLFKWQLHPYTKALLSAIPQAKLGIKKDRILLRGELSSPINPPNACRFAPRCNYAIDMCYRSNPSLEKVLPDHFVACHRVREINEF